MSFSIRHIPLCTDFLILTCNQLLELGYRLCTIVVWNIHSYFHLVLQEHLWTNKIHKTIISYLIGKIYKYILLEEHIFIVPFTWCIVERTIWGMLSAWVFNVTISKYGLIWCECCNSADWVSLKKGSTGSLDLIQNKKDSRGLRELNK